MSVLRGDEKGRFHLGDAVMGLKDETKKKLHSVPLCGLVLREQGS